jgi:hypothetical protein
VGMWWHNTIKHQDVRRPFLSKNNDKNLGAKRSQNRFVQNPKNLGTINKFSEESFSATTFSGAFSSEVNLYFKRIYRLEMPFLNR